MRLQKYSKYTIILIISLMLFWIFMALIIQNYLFPPKETIKSTYDSLLYYTNLKGYFGLDHISKGTSYLIGLVIPLFLFYKFKGIEGYISIRNIIGTIYSSLYFLVNGASLIIQGITAEFIINLISKPDQNGSHNFAINLFDWVITNGGVSFSTYIICNICLIIWINCSVSILKNFNAVKFKKLLSLFEFLIIVLVLIFILSSIFQLTSLSNIIFSTTDILAIIWIYYSIFNKATSKIG